MFTEIHFMYTLKITDSSSFILYLDTDQLFNPHLFSIFTWAWIHTHTHTHPARSRQTFEGKYDLENEFKNIQIANVILNIEKNKTRQ